MSFQAFCRYVNCTECRFTAFPDMFIYSRILCTFFLNLHLFLGLEKKLVSGYSNDHNYILPLIGYFYIAKTKFAMISNPCYFFCKLLFMYLACWEKEMEIFLKVLRVMIYSHNERQFQQLTKKKLSLFI